MKNPCAYLCSFDDSVNIGHRPDSLKKEEGKKGLAIQNSFSFYEHASKKIHIIHIFFKRHFLVLQNKN